jgi:hypothetical protein
LIRINTIAELRGGVCPYALPYLGVAAEAGTDSGTPNFIVGELQHRLMVTSLVTVLYARIAASISRAATKLFLIVIGATCGTFLGRIVAKRRT